MHRHDSFLQEAAPDARDLASPGKFRGTNFGFGRGGIIGFTGLVGSGHSGMAKAIVGLDPRVTGEVVPGSKLLPLGPAIPAIPANIGLILCHYQCQGFLC